MTISTSQTRKHKNKSVASSDSLPPASSGSKIPPVKPAKQHKKKTIPPAIETKAAIKEVTIEDLQKQINNLNKQVSQKVSQNKNLSIEVEEYENIIEDKIKILQVEKELRISIESMSIWQFIKFKFGG